MDTDGTELPDRRSARQEALHLMSDILRKEGDTLLADETWRMEVADAQGLVLFKLDLSIMDTQATHDRVRPGSSSGKLAT